MKNFGIAFMFFDYYNHYYTNYVCVIEELCQRFRNSKDGVTTGRVKNKYKNVTVRVSKNEKKTILELRHPFSYFSCAGKLINKIHRCQKKSL